MAVGGFSVLDNHLHLLVRLDPDVANGWSDEEVVRRWGRLFPPRDKSRQPLPVSKDWVEWRLKDAAVGGEGTRAAAKPELVHEVLEGAAVASGQPARSDPRVRSSRAASRAWRSSMKNRCWRPVRTSI